MEYCVSRNLVRIKLHVHTYCCVITVNFLVKLCARHVMLRALHMLSCLIFGTTLHGKNHHILQMKKLRFTEVKDLLQDASLIKWQGQDEVHLLPPKTTMLDLLPRDFNTKSLLLGNAHGITIHYQLELEQQILRYNPILNLFQNVFISSYY